MRILRASLKAGSRLLTRRCTAHPIQAPTQERGAKRSPKESEAKPADLMPCSAGLGRMGRDGGVWTWLGAFQTQASTPAARAQDAGGGACRSRRARAPPGRRRARPAPRRSRAHGRPTRRRRPEPSRGLIGGGLSQLVGGGLSRLVGGCDGLACGRRCAAAHRPAQRRRRAARELCAAGGGGLNGRQAGRWAGRLELSVSRLPARAAAAAAPHRCGKVLPGLLRPRCARQSRRGPSETVSRSPQRDRGTKP